MIRSMSEEHLIEEEARLNYYTSLFSGNMQAGHSPTDAAVRIAEAYLDEKPRLRGKHKFTRSERDAAFWSSGFLRTLPADAWHTEPLVLALARYMNQERVSNPALLEHIATIAPEAVRRAIRYSGLVLQQQSPSRGEVDDPGEVDLICARDGQVLVLEIKSTFLRRSQKDAWRHGTTTLRKAGLQLRRKVRAIEHAITTDADLVSTLGIETDAMPLPLRGWIVDTSIEHDHERFNGFLKVSLEEVLIALRDDRHLLNDPEGLLSGTWMEAIHNDVAATHKSPTLYPDGFTLSRFVEVIVSEAVWD